MAVSEAEMKDAFGSQQSLAAMTSTYVNRAKNEVVRYYKHPDLWSHPKFPNGIPNERAGWITCGDSQDSKFILMTRRGFQQVDLYMDDGSPLRIIDTDPNFQRYGKYGPLLAHEQGPALIPIEQILQLRWYRPDQCPIPDVHDQFPALHEWLQDNELHEYNCPECSGISVMNPLDLARHLRFNHKWTREDISALGREMGINFSQVYNRQVVEKMEFDLAPVVEASSTVPVTQTTVPARSGAKKIGRPRGSKNKT